MLLILLLSCGDIPIDTDQEGDGGGEAQEDGGSDLDAGTEGDAGDDGGYVEGGAVYEYADGFHTVDLGTGDPDGWLCSQVWWVEGATPVLPVPAACDGCEFVFDVSFGLDEELSTCSAEALGGLAPPVRLGFSANFHGYGESMVYAYAGSYYWWGAGTWSDGEFSYRRGDFAVVEEGQDYAVYEYGLAEVSYEPGLAELP